CEIVKSTQGNPKINVYGYLYVKDKNNGQRYYWVCESRKSKNCRKRATTDLEGKEHILK
ncbi:20017_t:CDS:1, partial [Funneliformis geosporum]